MVYDYLIIIIPAYVNIILAHQNEPAIIYRVVVMILAWLRLQLRQRLE